MSSYSSDKKVAQLGMTFGKASNILKKSIIFSLIRRLGENVCFQCNEEIKTVEELSIEHKIPYLDSENPIDLYFNLDNIAFSHFKCNCGAARQIKEMKHPSWYSYKKGCRCKECTNINTIEVTKNRDKRRNNEGVV